MKLWEKFKLTKAEELIMNNYGIRNDLSEPARAGEKRARVREAQKVKANAKIPVIDREPSRQVRRAEDRKYWKSLRSQVKAKRMRDACNKPGMIPT